MSTPSNNLWPADLLQTTASDLPVTILEEQALHFNQMAKNVLEAKVEVGEESLTDWNDTFKKVPTMTFIIQAPFRNKYFFTLFKLSQQDAMPYPCQLRTDLLSKSEWDIQDASTLKTALKEIFNDEKTKKILSNLMAQSRSSTY